MRRIHNRASSDAVSVTRAWSETRIDRVGNGKGEGGEKQHKRVWEVGEGERGKERRGGYTTCKCQVSGRRWKGGMR
jgi:hypothetical protein